MRAFLRTLFGGTRVEMDVQAYASGVLFRLYNVKNHRIIWSWYMEPKGGATVLPTPELRA